MNNKSNGVKSVDLAGRLGHVCMKLVDLDDSSSIFWCIVVLVCVSCWSNHYLRLFRLQQIVNRLFIAFSMGSNSSVIYINEQKLTNCCTNPKTTPKKYISVVCYYFTVRGFFIHQMLQSYLLSNPCETSFIVKDDFKCKTSICFNNLTKFLSWLWYVVMIKRWVVENKRWVPTWKWSTNE